MTLANKMTLARIICLPLVVLFLFRWGAAGKIMAFLIFLLASLSDLLDGWFARRTNTVTSMGKIMDPVADKVLIFGIFISFIQLHLIPFWMVIIIMARDFLVMALRVKLATRQLVLAAIPLAKLKTVFEYLVVFFILLSLMDKELGARFWWTEAVSFGFMAVAVTLALVSGLQYYLRHRRQLT